jgi:2',3'-cyclic-nucleotide 2'-phosphodiesterase (5'-nucleotidase family)
LIFAAATACAVGRTDPSGLRPEAEATVEPAPNALSTTSETIAVRAPIAPAPGVRTIGACDEAQRTKGVVRFTLAHFNDMQARYSDRIAGKSRYAYVAGWLRQVKRDKPNTLVLDAGDDYEKGALAEVRSMGETTRQMVQALPIDVRTIGNHDFAYGEQAVLRDLRLSQHPVLAANVRHAASPDADQPFERFVRVDVGCVKVGIIGLVTQNYDADDQPTKKPFAGVFAHDDRYAAILEREVKAHRGEVDVMIALTHLGIFDDMGLMQNKAAKGVDIVVGGHTEDLLKQPIPVGRRDGSKTWMVQAGHFAETLGRAEIAVDLRTHKTTIEKYAIETVDASMPVADDVAELAARLEREVVPDARTVVATTTAGIDRRDMPDLVWHAVTSSYDVDALVIGRDLFWDGLPRGDVTLQRLYDAVYVQRQPAGTSGFSSLWFVSVSGEELQAYKNRIRMGALYSMYAPQKIDPKKRYRLALDKRALTYPRALFGMAKMPEATFGGELIDILETHARASTAKNKPLE